MTTSDTPNAPTPSRRRLAIVVAGGTYALLILIVWAPFNLYSGFGYETAFPYLSESASWLGGFLYWWDPLRIHTNTFYHLSYLISVALGIRGSYVPYQIVYAALWWARGFLAFSLMRRFFPDNPIVAYLTGAFVLVHSSDTALQFIGQMNQFGFIFWMLAAFYLLVLAVDAPRSRTSSWLTVAACTAEYMSLWSYESQILLIIIFPLALLARAHSWRRFCSVLAAWYAGPCIYLVLTIMRYTSSAGHTYQESVLRTLWSPGDLAGTWILAIVESLAFWRWPTGEWQGAAPEPVTTALSLAAVLVFIAGGLAVCGRGQHVGRANAATWLPILGGGSVFLILSFPAYLLLEPVRPLWRTQLLSGLGSAMVLSALVGLVSVPFPKNATKTAVLLALSGLVIGYGSFAALQKSAFHRWYWERHRFAMLQILRVAPSVAPGTVIVLTNVSTADDPFVYNYWFDMALRLIYPRVPVAGIYFRADGTVAPGANLRAEGERWRWDGTGVSPLVRDAPISNSVVVRFDPSGHATLMDTMPQFVCTNVCLTDRYNPAPRITGPMSPIAARRYRPT